MVGNSVKIVLSEFGYSNRKSSTCSPAKMLSELFTLHYLRLSTLCLILKDENCGLTIYEQLKALYQILCLPVAWCWDGLRRSGGDFRDKNFTMMVVFERCPKDPQDDELYIRVIMDNKFTVYHGYVPWYQRKSLTLKNATCKMCKALPDRYFDKPAKFTQASKSRTVIFIDMKHIVTNVKVEIAECLELLIYFFDQRYPIILWQNSTKIRDVIIHKSWNVDKNYRHSKVTIDGAVVFDAPQVYQRFTRPNHSQNCFCTV